MFLASSAQSADLCSQAHNPSNGPVGAPVLSTPFCLKGALRGDGQNMVAWSLDKAGSAHPWRLTLAGIPGAVTRLDIFTVTFTEDGSGVSDYSRIYSLTDRGNGHPMSDVVMLRPGKYFLGLSHAGGGGTYRLNVAAVSGPAQAEREPNDDDSHAQPVDSAFAVDGDLNGSEDRYRWRLTKADAGKHWRLILRGPVDSDSWIKLYDAKGHQLGARKSHDGDHGRVVFDGLGLAAGSYLVRVGPAQDARTPYRLSAVANDTRAADQEDEPNDSPPGDGAPGTAQDMSGQSAWRGALGPNDPADAYTLTVPKTWRAKRVSVTLRPLDTRRTHVLSLRDASHEVMQAKGKGVLRLDDLALAPGKYALAISGQPTPYRVRIETRAPGRFDEGEPNATDQQARVMGRVARGRFQPLDGGDTDIWQFTTKAPAQFWAIHATGTHLDSLTYHGGVWFNASQGHGGSHTLNLGPLLLAPGKHYLSISGSSGSYVLTRRPLGPPAPDMEVEPNNSDRTAQPLVFGQPLRGVLFGPDEDIYRFSLLFGQPRRGVLFGPDEDIYRFSLPAAMHVRLLIRNVGDDGSFDTELYRPAANDGEVASNSLAPGGKFDWNGVLPAGDYKVNLRNPTTPSSAYRIALTRLDPFDLPRDREINDSTEEAAPLPADRILKGGFPFGNDEADYYRLPLQPVSAKVSVAPVKGAERDAVSLVNNEGYQGTSLPFKWNDKTQRYAGVIPANTQTFLRLPNSRYHMKVTLDPDPEGGPVTGPLPVVLKASIKATRAAAFRRLGQHIQGALVLRNTGNSSASLRLEGRCDAFSGHIGVQGWKVTFPARHVTLAPGASKSVPFVVDVAPDSYSDTGVPITLAARGPEGRYASTTVKVAISADARPVDPHPWNPLPGALLGGVDVSRPALGARLIDGEKGDEHSDHTRTAKHRLAWHNDMVAARFEGDHDNVKFTPRPGQQPSPPLDLPLELAGKAPVPVVGLVLTPAFYTDRGAWPRAFALQLSSDGKTWQTVLHGNMTLAPHQQAFPLSQPVLARYARLRILSSYGYQNNGYYVDYGSVMLGDWKVVAKPGFDPTGGKGFNLAAATAGGHLVWSAPVLKGGDNAEQLFSENPDAAHARIRAGKGKKTGRVTWVVGFHDDRAAEVAGFEWVRAPKSEKGQRLKRLTVSAAIDSPRGPWRKIGIWDLGAGPSPTAAWQLKKPVWARFLRFETDPLPKGDVVLAATLRIRERPASKDYLSALGEWGFYGPSAYYERTLTAPKPAEIAHDNTSRAKAMALSPATTVAGRVRIHKRVEWYRVVVPEKDNELRLFLHGSPAVSVRPVVLDTKGNPVSVTCKDQGPTRRLCLAHAAPGAYDVRIEEPRRSVVFAWDTSASVSAYGPQIYRALRRFSLGLDPKTEALNLLPFGHGSVLEPDWLVNPLQAVSALDQYKGGDDSSNSYAALKNATQALAKRKGARAIVLMTDAETGSYDTDALAMWRRFQKTPVRVFGVQLPSGALGFDPFGNRARMQDWAAEDGGNMVYATHQWEIDAAFARASAWLRQPKDYTLRYATARGVPPEPGHLRVFEAPAGNGNPPAATAAGGTTAVGSAVGLILDASGSMWKKIDGTSRIAAARHALDRIVTKVIPRGTPVALRVFGDQAPRSCKQALEVPLAPLTAARSKKLVRVINAVNPKSYSRTPIAASLQQMATHDLAAAKGKRLIVIVTDGRETCGGDPEAVIRKLRKQGIGVRLNIVGLAIADETLKRQFRKWATLGGGAYFDASNVKALREGVGKALHVPVPFTVLDANGKAVAQGVIGGKPVEVPAGRYRIRISAQPDRVAEVTVVSGKTVTISLSHAFTERQTQ